MRGCLVLFAVVFMLVALFAGGCAVFLIVDSSQHGFRYLSKGSLIASIVICALAGFFAWSIFRIASDDEP